MVQQELSRDNMKAAALMTARAGSKSVVDKNTLPCAARHVPMFLPNLDAASKCPHVDYVYALSDIPMVDDFAEHHGYTCIPRPEDLCGEMDSHYDVMRYGVDRILEEHPDVYYIVLLLGNNCGCSTDNLGRAIDILKAHPGSDSIMSVGKFNQFNTYRAFYKSDPAQHLTTCVDQRFIPTGQVNDKNVDGDVYFFNGSFWIVRKDVFLANSGLRPYTWLGRNILSYHQDEHIQEIDSVWQYNLVTQFRNSDLGYEA